MDRSFALAALGLAIAGTPSYADITPVDAAQSMRGRVVVLGPGFAVLDEASFDLSAPVPLGSWSAPSQNIVAEHPTSSQYARLIADYTASIAPDALTLECGTHTLGAGAGNINAGYEWTQSFFLKFTVTEPGDYIVGAQLSHRACDWISPNQPMTLKFGAEGAAPMVSLTFNAQPAWCVPPMFVSHGPARVSLAAGTYIMQADQGTLPIYASHGPLTIDHTVYFSLTECPGAYADCDLTGDLTVADFACFQNRFVAGDPYADCNNSANLTIADFACFQNLFVTGCP